MRAARTPVKRISEALCASNQRSFVCASYCTAVNKAIRTQEVAACNQKKHDLLLMALHNCRNQRKICSYDRSLLTVANAGKVCIVFVFEARRHTRMLRLRRQDSLRGRRSTLSNRFNEQFPRCSTKIDKSLEYYNADRSSRAIIIAAS
ncbi:hypothetical protein BDL97_03G119400 [Sphagnum fallax]|nr:hypothetical protein BDL97_03G119400 [Sphagnum fallax]